MKKLKDDTNRFLKNRLHTATNPNQGDRWKVLCVCSGGVLRSPTAAVILSQEPYNCNTRAVGIVEGFALIPIDKVLLEWSDEVVVMDGMMEYGIRDMGYEKNIVNFDIPDMFDYMEPELIELIKEQADIHFKD